MLQEINESEESLQGCKDIQNIKTWLTEFIKHVCNKVQLDQCRLNVMADECNISQFTEDVITGFKGIERKLWV